MLICSLSVLHAVSFLLSPQPQFCFLSLVFPLAFNLVCEVEIGLIIQDVSGGTVNILGGGSMVYSE